jgi:hypothetical protein
MKLEDRIHDIKTLLSYCPHSTEDVMLSSDDVLCKFFWNFFSSQPERFKRPAFDGSTAVRMTLLGMLDANYKDYHYTIALQYCYDYDRDGEDWTFYYFNDSECYYRGFDNPNIEYLEFPDDIWERIQNILYNKATEEINKELESAKSSVIYWENRKDEFDNKLKLK